jgi:hypothetical protein
MFISSEIKVDSGMFKGKKITREDIFTAIKDFDKTYTHTNQYDNWLEKDNYKFSLTYAGKYNHQNLSSARQGVSAPKSLAEANKPIKCFANSDL